MSHEKTCVDGFIKRAQHTFEAGGTFGDVIGGIKAHQNKIRDKITNIAPEARVPHAIAMSTVGLGAIAVYEWARTHGLHAPSALDLAAAFPTASFSNSGGGDVDQYADDPWEADRLRNIKERQARDEENQRATNAYTAALNDVYTELENGTLDPRGMSDSAIQAEAARRSQWG